MLTEGTSLINHDSIAKPPDRSSSLTPQPIFILCDKCYWCATYFDKSGLSTDNNCPQCHTSSSELTVFPIMSNELFSFNYDD